jgi:hypothetical protein
MRRKITTVVLGLVFAFIICTATSVRAIEYYGATQGFWKNHTELWTGTEYNTETLVMDVFDPAHLPLYMKGSWG